MINTRNYSPTYDLRSSCWALQLGVFLLNTLQMRFIFTEGCCQLVMPHAIPLFFIMSDSGESSACPTPNVGALDPSLGAAICQFSPNVNKNHEINSRFSSKTQ